MKTLLKDLRPGGTTRLQQDLYNSFLCLTAMKYIDYRRLADERNQDLQGRTLKAQAAIRELQTLNWINREASDLFSSFVDDKYPDWWTAFNSINTFNTLAQEARSILANHGFNIAAVMRLSDVKNSDDQHREVMSKIDVFTNRKPSKQTATKARNSRARPCPDNILRQVLKKEKHRDKWTKFRTRFVRGGKKRKKRYPDLNDWSAEAFPKFEEISKRAEAVHFKYFLKYLKEHNKTIECTGEQERKINTKPKPIIKDKPKPKPITKDEPKPKPKSEMSVTPKNKTDGETTLKTGRVSRPPEKYKDYLSFSDEEMRRQDEEEIIEKYPGLQYFRPGAIIMIEINEDPDVKYWPYQVLRWVKEQPNTFEMRAVDTTPKGDADGVPQKDKFLKQRIWNKVIRQKFTGKDVVKVGWNATTKSWAKDKNPLVDLNENVFEGRQASIDPDVMFAARERWIADLLAAYSMFDREVQGFNKPGEMKQIMVRMLRAFSFNPLSFTQQPFTFILQGPPGTGKTSMAQQLGKLFKASGYLLYGNTVLRGRDAFIGQYLGQTAPRTVNEIYSNLEKTLLIDEAYSLASYDSAGKLDSYSAEFFNAFTNELLQVKGKICIIAAGYEKEMQRDFLGGNEGLPRRFQNKITLKSFSTQELVNIFKSALRRQTIDDRVFSSDAYNYLKCFIQNSNSRDADFELLSEDDPVEDKPTGLRKLFAAQAGAVTMLADVASIYINAMSEEANCPKQKDCFDVCDMKNILVEYIEKGFTAEARMLKDRYDELDEYIQTFGNCFSTPRTGRSRSCSLCASGSCNK
jgi:hypothetical protein